MDELRPMVQMTYTTRNGIAPMGMAWAKQSTSPVKKKPRKNLILFPAKSASEPRMGMRSATTSEAMVCAFAHAVTSSAEFAAVLMASK